MRWRKVHPGDPEALLRPKEAARLFGPGVDTPRLRRWAIRGRLTRVTTPQGYTRYREHEVRELVDDVECGALTLRDLDQWPSRNVTHRRTGASSQVRAL